MAKYKIQEPSTCHAISANCCMTNCEFNKVDPLTSLTHKKNICYETSWSCKLKNARHQPKTCNETMLCDKLGVFVSRISLRLDGVTFVQMHTSFMVHACIACTILMFNIVLWNKWNNDCPCLGLKKRFQRAPYLVAYKAMIVAVLRFCWLGMSCTGCLIDTGYCTWNQNYHNGHGPNIEREKIKTNDVICFDIITSYDEDLVLYIKMNLK